MKKLQFFSKCIQHRSYSALHSTSKDLKNLNYDIVIVGGGIVGAALACKLRSNPVFSKKNIAVIEAFPPQPPLGCIPDLRAYTLSPRSKNVLEECGVWKKLPNGRILPFSNMQVWDGVGNGHICFDSKDAGAEYLGYVVENDVLQYTLYERMIALASQENTHLEENLTLLYPNKVQDIEKSNENDPWNKIHLEDKNVLKARLVVAADGGNSQVRKLCGFETWGWDYDHKAVVATVKTNQENKTAWQKFLPSGPLAMLPLRDDLSSIVWSCPPDMANRLVKMTDDEFIKALVDNLSEFPRPLSLPSMTGIPMVNHALEQVHTLAQHAHAAAAYSNPFQFPPQPIATMGKRISFPLRWSNAQRYVQRGVALVGDSAHTIHPLAGQGLNLGIADVESLCRFLEKAIQSGSDIGDPTVLEEYEKNRIRDNLLMGGTMDSFKRLFEADSTLFTFMRNFGMGTLNAISPIKTNIMRHAMGI